MQVLYLPSFLHDLSTRGNWVRCLYVIVLMHAETISKSVKMGYSTYRHCRCMLMLLIFISCFITEGLSDGMFVMFCNMW